MKLKPETSSQNFSIYAGMTTLERLVESDQLAAFDAAVEAKDRSTLTAILQSVGMADVATDTINTLLANPARYGYPREP